MTSVTLDLLEAIDHLPIGSKLLLSDVGWDEYEELIEEIGERRHLRISYDNFYFSDLTRILGKKRLDLEYDSPPDLVVEVDVGIPTFDKLAIYAGLGVPEAWRFDGQRIEFFCLAGKRYEKVPKSALFPFLPASAVTEHLRLRDTQGFNAICRAFRDWVRARKP